MPDTAALTTADGLRLHLRHWPAVGRARGLVQLVHGLGEHLERYAAVAQALNAQGWHVAGHDQRGHGRSEGPRGGLATPEALLADLALVHDEFRRRIEPAVHVLLGHSMGGLVAARFAAEALAARSAPWSRPLHALVLSSPALDAGMSTVQKGLLAVLGPLAPRLALGNGLKPGWISRDPAVVKAYLADPLVHDRITPALVRFIVDAGAAVQAAAPRWRLPTLLMWAGADRCVAPAGSERFAAASPPGIVKARPYAGLFHELFNEPEREQVLADLLRWLDSTATPGDTP